MHQSVLAFFLRLDNRVWFVREFGEDLMRDIIQRAALPGVKSGEVGE